MDPFIQFDDTKIQSALGRLLALGRNAAPVMQDIAMLGENSTRMRFRTQKGPDGVSWKKSLRAQITGGRTLTKDGHLGNSISSDYGADFAMWGVNRIYAAIHQLGGEIRAKAGGALKIPLTGGGFVLVKSVKMPARPYLGVNDDNERDILGLLESRISGAWGGANASPA